MKPLRAILFVSALLAAAIPARAVVEPNGANDADYINLAKQYSNSIVYIDISFLNGNGYNWCSGVLLNGGWVLSAAHPICDSSGNVIAKVNGIVRGNSVSPTSTVLPTTNTFVYPGYDNSGSTPDLILVKLVNPVSAPTLTFGSVSAGATVTSAGFGNFGTPDTGLQLNDGNARGWNAPIANNTLPLGAYSSDYYQSSLFGGFGVLNGKGAPGDSGSPVFDSSGKLVGINVAVSSGGFVTGFTTFDKLTNSDIQNWIQSIITPVEPQVVSLVREGADVRLTWQGKGGTNYVVQAASALGGTNTFTDLSAPIALPGVGPVVTNYLDAGALTNSPARFYRIRLQ